MKILLTTLFCTFLFLVNIFAQNPTWGNQDGSMNYGFSKYSHGGYNEQAYLWQDALLKGDVRTCIIAENITDSLMAVSVNNGKYLGWLSYNMEFVYNLNKQLEQLIINDEAIQYKTPKTIKNIRKESFTWALAKLHIRAYWIKDECSHLINYIYNDAGQIKEEQWEVISDYAQKISISPFEVLYDYKTDGSYTVKGVFKEEFDSEEGILKYLWEFNEKGQLIKRTLYNRELKDRKDNDPVKVEIFAYTYNEEGYLASMTLINEDKGTQTHFYKYIKEDKFGNWRIQQVYDDKQVLLFEMSREIRYKKH
jgi:hypothetical protein